MADIASIDTPDARTAVLHYKQPFFNYKTQFRWGILPRHSPDVGAPADIAKWKYNQTDNPNLGPFSVASFTSGQGAKLVRNPNFYLASEGKPYLDGINIVMRDNQETMRQAIMNGEATISPWLTQPAPAAVQELVQKGFTVGSGSSPYNNRIQLNLFDPKDPTRTKPHPILGDVKVREAILRGINVDNVIYNWDIPGVYQAKQDPNRFSPYGPAFQACGIQPVPYDLATSQSLLDSAGWKLGSDGYRYKNGQKMTLRVGTYTGYGQEDNVVVIISELKKLGIEGIADPIDVTVFYSSFSEKSPVYTGDFDILYWDIPVGEYGDAQGDVTSFYESSMIPSASNALGHNMNGIQDTQVDAWITQAAASLDPKVRAGLDCQILERVDQQLWAERWDGYIPNFQMSSPKLKGWTDAEKYVVFGSDSENWYLEP
jgi:peptide/nickel transport system substrate-binding protein